MLTGTDRSAAFGREYMAEIDISAAPKKGLMLAYYRKKRIVFREYDLEKEGLERLPVKEEEGGELLELHLFDADREFRAVRTEAGEGGYIVCRDISDSPGVRSVEEEVYLEEDFRETAETLRIVNYIKDRENGMIQISNYRLAAVREERADGTICESV